MQEVKYSKEDSVSFVWHLRSTVVHLLDISISSVEVVIGIELTVRFSTVSLRMFSSAEILARAVLWLLVQALELYWSISSCSLSSSNSTESCWMEVEGVVGEKDGLTLPFL